MPQPVVAHPETLKIVQLIHDTLHVVVRDTIVRVAEPRVAVQWVSIGAGFATIIAAGVAVWGIRSWRHQLKGSTEYRLAIRVLRAVLGLRDKITSARDLSNHMVPIFEGEKMDADTPEFVERERKQYWDYFREVIRADLALKSLRPEVEIHWGFDGIMHINAMDEMVRRLRGGYKAYFQHRQRAVRGDSGFAEFARADMKIIFEMKVENGKDEYGDNLDRVVEEARNFLKGKIDLTK